MANTIAGIVLVNGVPRDGVEVRLYTHDAPFAQSPPQGFNKRTGFIGTPFPSGGHVATVTSGPAYGGQGAFSFENVDPGSYYAGNRFAGRYSWEPEASILTSGSTSVSGPFAVSGVLTIRCPDDTYGALILARTNNVSGDIGYGYSSPTSGLTWTIRHSGNDRFARNSLQIFNEAKGHYGLSTTPDLEMDDDGQFHIIVKDLTHDNVSSPLRFEHYLLDGASPPAAGIGHSIEFSCQNSIGGGTVGYAHIQVRMVNVTAGDEDGTIEFRTMTNGVTRHRLKIREDGWIEINSQDSAGAENGKLGIFQHAHGDPDYGLVSLGNGGFSGSANHYNCSNGSFLAINASGDFVGSYASLQMLGVERFGVRYTGQTVMTYVDTDPTSAPYPCKVVHNCGTSGQVGIGSGIQFAANSKNGSIIEIGAIQIVTAGINTPKSVMNFAIVSGGVTRQVVKIDEVGTLIARFDFQHAGTNFGMCGATPVPRQVGASAAGIGAISDASAKAAVQALQTALAAIGAITSPA